MNFFSFKSSNREITSENSVKLLISYELCTWQETLSSEHLILRRAVVSCLRQLVQREAQEVSDHALSLAGDSKGEKASSASLNLKSSSNLISETGLEGALFSLLDKDSDRKLCSDIQDSLISLLQALATR